MSGFEEFAKRFHAVKEGVQEIAEQNLEKANSAYLSVVSEMQQTLRDLTFARQQRLNVTKMPADLAAWSAYIARLETTLKTQEKNIAALGETVEEKRICVKEAYIDQKKWSQIVEQHVKKRVLADQFGAQQQADESAVIRHGRGI